MHILSQLITVKTALISRIVCLIPLGGFCYVQPKPIADFSFEGACAGVPVQFKYLSNAQEEELVDWWLWDFGDYRPGEIKYAYTANPQHTYSQPGNYTVRLVVGSATGGRDTVSHRVEIFQPPEPPRLKDTLICFSDIADLVAQTRDINQIVWYENMETQTPIRVGDTFSTPPLPYSGTFYAEAVSPQSCRSERVPTHVGVFSNESARIVIQPEKLSLSETRVNFSVSTAQRLKKWVWDFGDGSTSNLPIPTHTYTRTGIYELSVVLTNEIGCQLNLLEEINIKNLSQIRFPSAFSPNSDGFNDTFEIEAEEISQFRIRITDQSGKLVFESTDKFFAWDGWGPDGELLEVGIYNFVITGNNSNGNPVEEHHKLTLIR